MQPSSSTPATIVSAENQDGATIVKATFFFCHYYIVWESNKAGEARGQSWNESLKSRWIPGGSYGYTSGTKQKHFAELSSPRPCWRWLQLQPSCGSPQWYLVSKYFVPIKGLLFVHYCNVMVCVMYCVGKWQSRGSTGMFGNLMAIYHNMLQFIQNHSRFVMLMKTCMIS